MPYRKQVLPDAAKEFNWFCSTYGREACDTAKQWTDALVAAASRGRQLASIKFDALLDEISSSEPTEDADWRYVIQQFRNASAKEKLLAMIHFAKLQAPWKQHAATREILCLGHVQVELYAYYQVNRVKQTVVFTKFDYCGVEKAMSQDD
ncbi:MAG TPA: hypothetical protein VFE46_08765 [Pirellulales bacterium]|jgi:hypothetical protein|nr:hypothetical protein [Pirellulales bacterium]